MAQPSWRSQSPPAGSAQAGPSWRKPVAAEAGPRRRIPWLRWTAGLLSAAAVVGCIALLIVLILMPGCNSTGLYVVAVPEYTDEALPPNPFAAADSTELGALPSFKTVEEAPVRVDLSKWLAKSSGREAAVIYVNMLGGRDGRGTFLFPSDAGPDDPANFVSLDSLWEALKSSELRRRKKLLLLDLARIESDGRLGLIENRVLDEIEEEAASVENLVVLCSCRPGETSWTSADLGPNGQSVFAHYVGRGLAGDADRNGNNRVSIAELFEYVHVSTRNWVIQNREPDGQHPWLIPSPDKLGESLNFTIVTVRDGSSPQAGPRSASTFTEGLAKLHSLWEARDRLREAEAWRSNPLRWRQLEFRLSRAEEWLLARNERRAERLLDEARRTLDVLRQTDPIAELQSHPFVYENVGRRSMGQPPKETRPNVPETHLKALLERDLPGPQNPEAVSRAVAIRKLAEEAANGPLGTHSWVTGAVATGDAHRRAGEDLLLAGESRRENALAELSEAEEYYRHAISLAQTVEAAERLYHRLLAELPALADWASFRRSSADRRDSRFEDSTRGAAIARYVAALSGSEIRLPELAELDALLRNTGRDSLDALEIEILMSFADARDLQRRLDPARNSPDQIARLRDTTAHARERLKSLITRLETHARQLATNLDPAQPQQVHRTEVRNALNWRFLPADVRRDLIQKLVGFERRMNERTEEVEREQWKVSLPETDEQAAGARALWHGLWAVHSATLGEPDAAAVEKVWLDWKTCAQHQNDPARQRELFVRLGDAVRQTWLAKRQSIRRRSDAGSGGPDTYRESLVEADRLARSVHGYDAEHLAGSVDPAKLLRDYDLAELCLASAERLADDYYASVGGGSSSHWFDQAAQQCLGAAQQRLRNLAGAPLSRRAGELEILLRDRRQARLQLRPTAAVEFGLAQRRDFELGVERDGNVPDGTAVLWLEQLPGNELTIDGDREAIATAGGTAAFWAAKSGAFDESNCRPEVVRPQLLFRGHRWGDDQIQLNGCRPTGTFVSYQPPGNSGAVIVEGTDRRPIMFVLDCSGSMKDKLGNGQIRFETARKTLKETLTQMSLADPPHEVGLMVYAHRMRYRDGRPELNPDWRLPVPPAVRNEPMLDYEVLNSVRPLTQARLAELHGSLNRVQPWGNTPLLGAILSAGRQLEELGGGLIAAITDGEYQDKEDVQSQLAEFLTDKRARISLTLVGYDVTPKDARTLRGFTQKGGGEFVEAPNANALFRTLQQAIKPRRYKVAPRGPGEPREQELGQPIDGLARGSYRVQFAEAPPIPFEIAGGERLVFQFEQSLGRLRHVKGLTKLPRMADAAGGTSDGEPDRLGYDRFKIHADGRAEFILALVHERNEFPVRRPQEIHFDVRPQGLSERLSCEIHLEPQQSTPAWNVVVHDWPGGQPAEVEAFWKLQRTAPDLQVDFNTLGEKPVVRLPTEDHAALRVSGIHEGTVVRLEVKAADPGTRIADLADCRVELGDQPFRDEFRAYDLPYRCEHFADEQTLIFEFQVGEDFDPDKAVLGITTLASRRSGSVGLAQPLVLPKHDDQL